MASQKRDHEHAAQAPHRLAQEGLMSLEMLSLAGTWRQRPYSWQRRGRAGLRPLCSDTSPSISPWRQCAREVPLTLRSPEGGGLECSRDCCVKKTIENLAIGSLLQSAIFARRQARRVPHPHDLAPRPVRPHFPLAGGGPCTAFQRRRGALQPQNRCSFETGQARYDSRRSWRIAGSAGSMAGHVAPNVMCHSAAALVISSRFRSTFVTETMSRSSLQLSLEKGS